MRTLRRVLVVALLVALPLIGAACYSAPPPASDTVGTAIYNAEQQLKFAIINLIICGNTNVPSCIGQIY